MKWIVRTLIVISLIILLIVAIGMLLPKQHTITRQASYHQPPEAIWQAITNYQEFPKWRKTVLRVEPFPSVNGNPAWTEVADHNMRIPLQVTESIPPQRLVTRIADPKLPWGGTWTTEIIPAPSGSSAGTTLVRITENGEVANPIFRFMSRFVLGYTSTIDTYLKALGEKFGEQVKIQG